MINAMRSGNSVNRLVVVFLAATLICSFVAPSSAAPQAAAASQKKLPSAEEILDRYIKATGGKKAYDKIKNRVTKSTMEIAGQGIKLSLTVYAAKPNLFYTLINSEATGKIENGTDGKVVWENSLLKGPAIKKGQERSDSLREATFDRLVYWKSIYSKAECVGEQAVDGKMCYKIVLTPKQPKVRDAKQKKSEPLNLYIDAKSNLATKIEWKLVTAAGTIPIEGLFSDYRKVDEILISHKLVMKILNQERTMTITGVEQNVKLPKDRFKLPDEIQKLADKEKEKSADGR